MKFTRIIQYVGVSAGSLFVGILLAFGLTAFAQTSSPVVGFLNWTGTLSEGAVTGSSEYSCDPGYTLQIYHSVVDSSSNNAWWLACTYGSAVNANVNGASPVFHGSKTCTAVEGTIDWNSGNNETCTGENFSTGGASSGTLTERLGTYYLDCSPTSPAGPAATRLTANVTLISGAQCTQ